MKDKEVRKNMLSFKTTDAVLEFINSERMETGDTPSTQIHRICDRARLSKLKRRGKNFPKANR